MATRHDEMLPAITKLIDHMEHGAGPDWANLTDLVADARVELDVFKRKSRLLRRLGAKQRARNDRS